MTINNHKIEGVGPIQIYYNPRRTDSHYYARVVVDYSSKNSNNCDKTILRKTIEVILNGPGKNKAIKKVRNKLRIYKTPGRGIERTERNNCYHLECKPKIKDRSKLF